MRISARADYGVRAMIELALADGDPTKLDALASAQSIPPRFLEQVLAQLRRSQLIIGQRGSDGGYLLAKDAATITVADIMRAVEGPLANVQGVRPEAVQYPPAAAPLREVWVAMRAALREVLETVTVADLATGELPEVVERLTAEEQAWAPR